MSENVSEAELRQYVERIERIEEEIDGGKADRKDVYAELKAVGYDTKAVRKIVRIRKMDPTQRQIDEAVEETYRAALGL
jgi:uncharacterized protein (UPF0335 family)